MSVPKGRQSAERLVHMTCGTCRKWWSIGDAPRRKEWFCPWCGRRQGLELTNKGSKK